MAVAGGAKDILFLVATGRRELCLGVHLDASLNGTVNPLLTRQFVQCKVLVGHD